MAAASSRCSRGQVRITHAWMERTAWQPPAAVTDPVFPKDGATVDGTRFTFRWNAPATASAPADQVAKIVDYQFQVCDRQDMRWPLSPTFDRTISLTPSKGKAEWAVPSVGLFNPGEDYWWRVRAKDSHGAWGPWSRPFAFRCAAPAVPVNVKVIMDGQGSRPVAITWEDGAKGRETTKPATYRIYGSNEQGFTASDAEYVVRMGHGFCQTMKDYGAKTKAAPVLRQRQNAREPPRRIKDAAVRVDRHALRLLPRGGRR